MPGTQRDPISEMFDGAARTLLSRAYARPGEWIMSRVADPTPRQRGYASERGIQVDGPDNPSVRGGKGLNARTRWCRAFARALYYNHKWYSATGQTSMRSQRRTSPRAAGALRIEIGRHMPARGVIPAGRAIRIQVARGGQAKDRAVRRLPSSARWVTEDKTAGPRQSSIDLRDW
jgi:hypothetical protein